MPGMIAESCAAAQAELDHQLHELNPGGAKSYRPTVVFVPHFQEPSAAGEMRDIFMTYAHPKTPSDQVRNELRFPQGGMKRSDQGGVEEAVEETAARELREEFGIDESRIILIQALLGPVILGQGSYKRGGYNGKLYVPMLVSVAGSSEDYRKDPSEVGVVYSGELSQVNAWFEGQPTDTPENIRRRTMNLDIAHRIGTVLGIPLPSPRT